MSGKVKIRGFVFGAVLVLLFAGMSFGQANQDPCGGKYAGEGLKALFWPDYQDLDPQNPGQSKTFLSNILNDLENFPYQYQVPGGDCVFLFRRGHVIVDVNRAEKIDGSDEDRYIKMNLVLAPNSAYCTSTPATLKMAHIHTVSFGFGTEKEFIATRENGKLILNCKKYGWNYLNFATMTPGQTTYTQISFRFKVFGSPDEYGTDTQAKVFYGILEETGTLGWRVTPIYEPFVVRVTETRGKKIIEIQDTPHYSTLYQVLGFPESDCPQGEPGPPDNPGLGVYEIPFALILQRLN